MNKVKVICYLVIFVLPTWFIFNIYIDRFSSSIEIAQKNVYTIYSEVGFPKNVEYIEGFNMNKHRNSSLYVGVRYDNKSLSKEEIENFYNDKLTSLGWEKVEDMIYRRNKKEWIRVAIRDNERIALRIVKYIFEYDSDKGLEALR